MENERKTSAHSHAEKIEAPSCPSCQEKEEGEEESQLPFLLAAFFFLGGLLVGHFVPKLASLSLAFYIFSYVIAAYPVVMGALQDLRHGELLDERFLMTLSSFGAFAINEPAEAVTVMLLYQLGEFLEDKAVDHSEKSISSLLELRPETALLERDGEYQQVDPATVRPGDHILVKAGERIPLDGTVIQGHSFLDTKAITGESLPREVREGDPAYSGCINQSGPLTIEVTKELSQSTVSRIIDLVENAASAKAPAENFVSRFAKIYTPLVVALAAALALIPPLAFQAEWSEWIHRALTFLVISCPCAFVIAIPLSYFCGIGASSQHGILVKGSNYLDSLHAVDCFVFDKTGTLTEGVFELVGTYPAEGVDKEDLLAITADAEALSNHPIAQSIRQAYAASLSRQGKTAQPPLPENNRKQEEIFGRGVKAEIDGHQVLAGNEKLMEEEGIDYQPILQAGSKVYTSLDGHYLGCLVIADREKADSRETIRGLKSRGMKKILMLSGDSQETADQMAEKLGLDMAYANLLPEEKVDKLDELMKSRTSEEGLVAFVGDGVNDAPVLARSDLGIAMGGLGADAAIQAADIVLMDDQPLKLLKAVDIAHSTNRIVKENIAFALAVKVIALLLGALGISNMWQAVFADVGVTLICILNALRLLKK